MEFHEKLRELRNSRGLTQEELAEALFVSRTAVSKWEAGRGYPSIDSLKQISRYFSVTIDDLLSGEKLISIAKEENKARLEKVHGYLIGALDLFSFALIVLPLYPKPVDGYVYSVNLISYTETSSLIRVIHWSFFLIMIMTGAVNILLTHFKNKRWRKGINICSMVLGTLTVLFLAMTREAYAIIMSFLLLTAKGVVNIMRIEQTDNGT